MRTVGVNWAAGLISFCAVVGLTSVLLVMQMGASRIIFAMSRDRLLPSVFSKVHKNFGTPHIATVFLGLFIAIGTLFLDLEMAGSLCNIGTFTAFTIVCLSVVILRITEPNRERPFKVPFSPIVPLLGSAICIYLSYRALQEYTTTLIFFVGWIIIGLAIYFSYGFNKNKDIEGE